MYIYILMYKQLCLETLQFRLKKARNLYFSNIFSGL